MHPWLLHLHLQLERSRLALTAWYAWSGILLLKVLIQMVSTLAMLFQSFCWGVGLLLQSAGHLIFRRRQWYVLTPVSSFPCRSIWPRWPPRCPDCNCQTLWLAGASCQSGTRSGRSSTPPSSSASASVNPPSGRQLPLGFGCRPSSVQLPGVLHYCRHQCKLWCRFP